MEFELRKGMFLISSPQIQSGIFSRSVILLCENDANGSLGIIVNRPVEITLPIDMLDLGELKQHNMKILTGGPVQTNQLMLLHMCKEIPDQTMQIAPGIFLGGDLEFLRSCARTEHNTPLRLCFGYAGWSPGQLLQECAQGSWFTAKATARHVFFDPPQELWRILLREKGGRYAPLSMMPDDLSWN